MSALPATPPGNITLDGDASGPPAPGGVTATVVGTDSIGVTWNAVAGASGYNVYRTTTPRDGGLPLGSRANSSLVSGGTTFTDTGLTAATEYSYVVTTVTAGVQSAASSEVTATTPGQRNRPTRINAGGAAVTSVTGASFRADSLVTGGQTYSTNAGDLGDERPVALPGRALGPVHLRDPGRERHVRRAHALRRALLRHVGERLRGQADVLDGRAQHHALAGHQEPRHLRHRGVRTALVKTVSGVEVTNGTLSVKSVYGSVDDPEITAIEVVPAASGPVAPTVTTTVPASGVTGVAPTTTPKATFSRAMDPATLTTASFKLTPAGGSPVAATVSYDGPTSTATLTPSAPLAYSTTYTATVTTAA